MNGWRKSREELEAELTELQERLRVLETEANRLREAGRHLANAYTQNEKLVNALHEAREQIAALKEEVDKLTAPPSTYGVFLSVNDDGTVNVLAANRKIKVNL